MIKKFGYVRVGAATPELKVANVKFNVEKIKDAIKEAESKDVQILLFPELCITGYTCADLFMQDTLIENAEKGLLEIVESTMNNSQIVIVGMPFNYRNKLYNVAVAIQNGKILGIVPKVYIPNYSEFYEKRWFNSGLNIKTNIIEFLGSNVPFGTDIIFEDEEDKNISFGIEICEDLWAINPPSNNLALNGATIIFNLSASNEMIGKYQYRKDLIKMQSAKLISAYIFTSCGINESTTDLVFGGYKQISENGTILAEDKKYSFESELIIADVDTKRLVNERMKNTSFLDEKQEEKYYKVKINIADDIDELKRNYQRLPFVPGDEKTKEDICKQIMNIQSAGLAKRIKHIGTNKTVIGMSGGLDSTLAFLVITSAYKMLGIENKNIIAITMPGFGTTDRTYNNAINLIKEFGATLKEISIKEASTLHLKDIGHDIENKDITYENAQARERTQILMDIANDENAIVVGTGDLSELALGWCTYNGDHMSMYAVNTSIPKTLVNHLVKNEADLIRENNIKKVLYDICATPISPELLPPDDEGKIKQKTEDSVGPYILHDFFLYHFLRYGASPAKILMLATKTFENEYKEDEIKKWLQIFIKKFFTQQFKRSCIPDGPKVGTIAISPRGDLRMPSDANYEDWIAQIL